MGGGGARRIGVRPEVGSNRWTGVIGGGLSLLLRRRARRLGDLSYWARETGAVQRRELRGLLSAARGTAFGREAGFGSLLRHEGADLERAFRESVAPAGYESFRGRLSRMREDAEPDVLWPGIVYDWAQTSGTTGGEKYIPVSREMLRSNRKAGFDIFAHSMRAGVPLGRIFGGKMVFLGGSTDVSVNEHGVRTGDLSGLATGLIRWPLTEVYLPGSGIALESHWPTKVEKLVDRCLREDVRFFSGMASWSLLVFERLVERARELGVVGRNGVLRDVWPNLTTFVHGGVRYGPFDPSVRRVWSGRGDVGDARADVPHRLEVYPASEGFVAMQDTAGDPGLRLLVDHGVYYEFLPAEEVDPERPDEIDAGVRAFGAHEVEKGVRYVVCMTTCAGLWRYVIGDLVEFDTVPPEGPARLRIVGRHRHFMNAFGENLISENIEDAAVAAREAVELELGEFTAGPVYPSGGREGGLELVVEVRGSGDIEEQRLRAFGGAFDAALRKISVDYDTKRTDSVGMGEPVVTVVGEGVFSGWMASRGKLGGQNKVPRVANHREFVDGLREAGGVGEGATGA